MESRTQQKIMDKSLDRKDCRRQKAKLILEDGREFCGESFGADSGAAGEVVFNTAMTGYPESLTDPSYSGQLVALTYPLIGNYGVPPFTIGIDGLPDYMESEKIHARGVIVSDYSERFSHWNGVESLETWLRREGVAGITGIDTRALTQILREGGVLSGRIVVEGHEDEVGENEVYGDINFVDRVSTPEIVLYNGGECRRFTRETGAKDLAAIKKSEGRPRVVLLDCGVKANIIRCLVNRGAEVVRVPWNYDFNQLEFDALFLSNGPGDPDTAGAAVENIRKVMNDPSMTIFGICMGNQLLAKAAGANIFKLKYGHRSHNQPVRMEGTSKCFITSQNHGYAVDSNTLPADWNVLFTNLNDGSNEGIRHKNNPWFSAQFHPEAASGPTDTQFLFDEFMSMIRK